MQAKLARGSAEQLNLQDRILFAEGCLLYTSDAADERSSVDLGGRRIIKNKTNKKKKHTKKNNTPVTLPAQLHN